MGLRLLLAILGAVFSIVSRRSDVFRRQLSRNVVVEISSADGVARSFEVLDRRMTSRAGTSTDPDLSIRFSTANEGLLALLAPDGPTRLFDGMLDGSIELRGDGRLLLWFQGLVPAAMPGFPAFRLPGTPPNPYVRPTSNREVNRRIVREPAADTLDPSWPAAAEARKKAVMMRVAAGETAKKF